MRARIKFSALIGVIGFIAISGAYLQSETRLHGAVYSSDLGWNSGQDVSGEIGSLLANRFKAGDTLVLEDTYQISGANLRLPKDFTLTAVDGGGFDVRTSAKDSSALFVLSDGVTIDNMTFTAIDAPGTGYRGANPQSGTDYHAKRVLVVDGDDVTIEDSAFTGNVAMHVDVPGGDDLTIRSSYFEGGFYQVRLVGGADDARILSSHFRKSLGDGIKTEGDNTDHGPQRMQVIDSFFDHNARDGIDTAGGFRDGHVQNSVFYGNGVSGMDIKSLYYDSGDLNPTKMNSGIVVEGSQFINSPNGVVVTVLDRGNVLTAANVDAIPHDIHVTDSIFENTSPTAGMRAFLVKDGYDITWDDLTFNGEVAELRFMKAEVPFNLSGVNVQGDVANYGEPRNVEEIEKLGRGRRKGR
ncbi:right-handed parallel beta-helix repeat-containing protein [Pikeienuella piscinae]|uniref:Right-handed parallel beta-helix repeat-containing protein n=1 Tax=Pikeienuella piscinae TaxID=2748098 RepID=A0A7L5BXS7_9RHOB|nr:right-handed parallel beta-helix repeat-containing protein [Pikeienuella piscinae]QIE55943.1 right-handed parallel beta-helix repeat-containing protein [Pikeienuella piscinae]